MTSLQDRVNDLIEDHCQTRTDYREQRFRVAMAELTGQPSPELVAGLEGRLTRVYGLLHDASKELAAVSAALEFNEMGEVIRMAEVKSPVRRAKSEVQPVRRYSHLDSIACQRQGSDVKRRESELRSCEASLAALPLNPGSGYHDPGRAMMQASISEMIEQKRAALKAARELDGDARVVAYCGDIIAQQEAPTFTGELVQQDGSPLYRGAMVQPICPGM